MTRRRRQTPGSVYKYVRGAAFFDDDRRSGEAARCRRGQPGRAAEVVGSFDCRTHHTWLRGNYRTSPHGNCLGSPGGT